MTRVTTVGELAERSTWVRFSKGTDGEVIGRCQEGNDTGKVILPPRSAPGSFADFDGLYGRVRVVSVRERFAIGLLDVYVTVCDGRHIPVVNTIPLFRAGSLDAAIAAEQGLRNDVLRRFLVEEDLQRRGDETRSRNRKRTCISH